MKHVLSWLFQSVEHEHLLEYHALRYKGATRFYWACHSWWCDYEEEDE